MLGLKERQRVERESFGIIGSDILRLTRVNFHKRRDNKPLMLSATCLFRKYERTKQVAMEFKDREEGILQDRKTLTDSLKMQEARYDKMKAHAMSQLEM